MEWPTPTTRCSELKTEGEDINDFSSALAVAQLHSGPGRVDTSFTPTAPEQAYSEDIPGNRRQSDERKEEEETVPQGRHAQQLVMSLITHKVLNAVVEEPGHKANRTTVDDPGAYVALIHDLSNGDRVESSLKDRRAFFDVDEPRLVLTPFNANLEVLPRPETRSMSISWIVQDPRSPGPEFLKAAYHLWKRSSSSRL
jgi:hypothetical protein